MFPDPFFTIVIPTFNCEKILFRSIKSVLDQKFESFEILIIDGASSDLTIKIAQDFNDKRIRIFSEPDLGIYDAMNKGIARSKGKWIYFLGSDDYFLDDNVLSDVQLFIRAQKPLVIYGNVKIDGNADWAKDGEIYAGEFNYSKLLKMNICHQCIFYNLEFLFKHNFTFDLKYPISSDWDFNFKCWNKSAFVYIARTIAVFSVGGFSSKVDIVEPFISERRKYIPYHLKVLNKLMKWKGLILPKRSNLLLATI